VIICSSRLSEAQLQQLRNDTTLVLLNRRVRGCRPSCSTVPVACVRRSSTWSPSATTGSASSAVPPGRGRTASGGAGYGRRRAAGRSRLPSSDPRTPFRGRPARCRSRRRGRGDGRRRLQRPAGARRPQPSRRPGNRRARRDQRCRLRQHPHGRHGHPHLTTVALPLEQAGRVAIELLLERLAQPGSGTHEQGLPAQLIVRASTAPPRSGVRSGLRGTRTEPWQETTAIAER